MNKPVVVITGASRGIGKACAICFAENGYRLVINALNDSIHLKETEKILYELNADFYTITADISSHLETTKMFDKINERFRSVDILINNAGISYIGLTGDMTVHEWDKIIRTNLTSVFYCCKEVIPDMVRKKQGRIINISSVWGVVGSSCEAAYSASKGGVNAFTKSLAKELAPSGISVNAIAFGLIDTDMNNCFSNTELTDIAEQIPTGRMASAKEAGSFIYQIATAESYLTGQVITFDGGWQ